MIYFWEGFFNIFNYHLTNSIFSNFIIKLNFVYFRKFLGKRCILRSMANHRQAYFRYNNQLKVINKNLDCCIHISMNKEGQIRQGLLAHKHSMRRLR